MKKFENLNQVIFEAKRLMELHGLMDLFWRFELSRGKRRLGYCCYSERTVSLSKIYIENNLERGNFLVDTILHEIAHALNWIRYKRSGHDYTWKRICIEIGANPKRVSKSEEVITMPKGKFIYVCSNCGRRTYYHKLLKRQRACGVCCKALNGGRFDKRFLLQLEVAVPTFS